MTEIAESDVVARSRIAARAADAKKGDDIVILDVGQIMGIVESFVITSAPNSRLVRAIVDEVERELFERTGDKPRAVEGLHDASWVLLDYGDLVVHVFLTETREVLRAGTAVGRRRGVPWADNTERGVVADRVPGHPLR